MMKRRIVFYAFVSLFILGCNAHTDDIDPLKKQLADVVKNDDFDNISLSGMDGKSRKSILHYFSNSEARLEQVDNALNKGYFLLLEDIAGKKYPCITQDDLKKYESVEWSERAIGFRNWITDIQGGLLLQQANHLKYQILILKLMNDDTLIPLISQKEKKADEILKKIVEYTKEENRVD